MNTLTIFVAAIAMFAMTARAELLEFVALPVKKSAASFAEAAAARAVVEEVFPSPAAEPETQAADDLFSSWQTLSQHRQLQSTDCDDPAGGCVADYPSFWCRAFLECSPTFLYTWQCSGWFCGWCSSKYDKKTMCKSDRSQFCNGGGDQQCRP